jgi:hypothetical protein
MSRGRKKKGAPPAPPVEAASEPEEERQEREEAEPAAAEEAPPVRRGLRRSRPISVIPEVTDVDQEAERRKRFFTRPLSGDSGVQSASGVRRRWRWFRPRSESRPPSDLTDTEARAEAAKSAAAELRTRLSQGDRRRTRPPPPIPPLPPVFTRSRPPSQSAPVSTATLEVKPPRPPSASDAAAPETMPAVPTARAVADAPPILDPPSVAPAASPRPAEPGLAAQVAEPATEAPRPPRPPSRSGARARAPTGKPLPPSARPGSTPRVRESALRRWRRPLVELSLPTSRQNHDILVLAVVLVLFAGGVLLQRRLSTPALLPTNELGLHVSRPAGWLPARRVGAPTAGLAAPDPDDARPRPADAAAGLPYHVVIQSALDPTARLEIRIAERPTTGNLRSALVLQRVSRHGEALWAADSADRTIGGRDWVRTAYRYTYKGSKTDAPRIATGIEYATINGRLLYTVTLHGSAATAPRLEALLVPTLAVDANHPAAVGAR